MPTDEEKSPPHLTGAEADRIEELRKSLYSKSNPPSTIVKRHRLHSHNYDINADWPEEEQPEEPQVVKASVYTGSKSGLFKGILVFSIVFFLLSLGVAAYVFYKGSNVVSSNNINISIIGPVSIAAGAPLSLDVDITNKNNTSLTLADIAFDYPEGTKSVSDFNTPLRSEQIPIDLIASGGTVRKTVKSVLYGEENSRENIRVMLTYRIPGSNAVFTKESEYSVLIASAPVTLAVNSLREINSGQELTLNAHIVSNSPPDINNLLLKVDYPFGFTFESASPTPSYLKNVWNLGTLSQGDTRDIKITGKITGQDGDERVFHFYTGTATSINRNNIDTLFLNFAQSVDITKPFLATLLTLDEDASDIHPAHSGKIILGVVRWQNNLDTPINDAVIQVKLDGQMIDKTSVDSEGGFYNSSDNTITWDKSGVPDLDTILGGANGTVHFSFSTLESSFEVEKSFRNPVITLSESVTGKRFSGSSVPQSIISNSTKTVRVSSNLSLTSSVVHSIGPFTNTGPVPPKAEQPTTYTINWAITNSYNQADNTIVTATLPGYVKWLGKFSPNTENVTFNPDTSEIKWQPGRIPPGTGFTGSPKSLSFQVSFLPSVSQVGTTPYILNPATVKGTDNFTNTLIGSSNKSLDTKMSSDPGYHYGDEQVVP